MNVIWTAVLLFVPVILGTEIVEIAAGYDHSLALDGSGNVWAWGSNGSGQLGQGDLTEKREPTLVRDSTGILDGIIHIAAGYCFSCAMTEDRRILCWGLNDKGQLGNGTVTNYSLPCHVRSGGGALSGIMEISAGAEHIMALTSAEEIYLWGSNEFGQLGRGTTGGYETLPVTPWGTDWELVEAGAGFSLAVRGDSLLSWGSGESGQLANDTTLSRNMPQYALASDGVNVQTGIVDIAASKFGIFWSNGHVLAEVSGNSMSWGRNAYGQLGDNTTNRHSLPADILSSDGLASFGSSISFSTGKEHSAIISPDGLVWGMGDNYYGQLGNPFYTLSALPIPILNDGSQITGGVDVSCGGNFTLVLTSDAVYATGSNTHGQLGEGTTTTRNQAVAISFIPLSITENVFDEPESVSLTLSPNPFNSVLHVEAGEKGRLEILDLSGRLIHSVDNVQTTTWNFDNDLPSGIYLIRWSKGDRIDMRRAVMIR